MKVVSKNDQTTKALKKRIKDLETTITNIRKEEKDSLELYKNFNIVSESANKLYTINDFDIHCRFTYVSPSVTRLAGYTPEEMIGKSCFDYIHPEDKKNIVLPLLKSFLSYKVKNLLKGELKDNSQTYRYRLKDKMGNWRYAETTSNFLGNKLVNITTDIGDKKEYEKKLQKSKVDYVNLLSNLNDIYYRINKEGVITDINPAVEQVTGHLPEKLIGNPVKDVFEEQNDRYDFISAIKKNGIVKNHKLVFTKTNGNKIYVTTNAYIVKDDNGNPIGIEGILHDVTDTKNAEAALLASEQKYKDLVEKSNIAILIEDNDGNFTYFNESFHKLFGYTVDEIKKISNSDLMHPDDFKKVMGYHNKRIKGKKAPSDYEHRAIKKDGSTIYLSLNVIPVMENNKIVGTHSYIWDITDRKQTEDALRDSEEKFRDMANLLPQGIFEHSLEGKLTFVNEQGLKLFGYSRSDLKKGINFLKGIIPEERARAKKNTDLVMNEGNPKDHEFTALRKDGSTFPVLIYTSLIYKNGEPFGVRGVIIDNTVNVEAEKKMKIRNKELELWHDVTVGRELKMIELKKEINEILKKYGEEPKYKIIR
jgi:PAS domain S-box-containing protein